MWRPGSYESNVDSILEPQRHITTGATFLILCAAAHKVREIRTPGATSVAPCRRMEYSSLGWLPWQSLASSQVPSLAWCPVTSTAKRRQGDSRPKRK